MTDNKNLFKYEPTEIKHIFDGIQYIFRFDNTYRVSVIKHRFSYGYEQGLWEIGVLDILDEFETGYDFLGNGVIGYLNVEQVNELLEKVKNL